MWSFAIFLHKFFKKNSASTGTGNTEVSLDTAIERSHAVGSAMGTISGY